LKQEENRSIFEPISYKISTKANWNTVAFEYHYNWADQKIGPFKSTEEVVKAANIQDNDRILDIACGTGVVSKEISQLLGPKGLLIGIDLSRTALNIAKKTIASNQFNAIEMDVENLGLRFKFDKITCQYGLMFFPDCRKVLGTVKELLDDNGVLVVAVHGLADDVPYFSTIMKPILEYIPDIRPKGSPTVHRFGNPDDLEKELAGAGFSDIKITRHEYIYEPGTFEEYWNDYMNSTANSIRSKIESRGKDVIDMIKNNAEKNASKYTKNNNITFPWTIFIASCSNKT